MGRPNADTRGEFSVSASSPCSIAVLENKEWRHHPGTLFDVSLKGAKVECDSTLPIGASVTVDLTDVGFSNLPATVVRQIFANEKPCFSLELTSGWPPEAFYSLAFPARREESEDSDESEVNLLAESKSLAGYQVVKQIGRGGSGNVYEVQAPGGFTKALKRVPLDPNSPLSIRELWGFRLIRSIRHPFLLSIDRLTVEDNHLLVVMELADGHLEAEYRRYLRKGLRGVPRDRLLLWMREAAEVLDVLNHRYRIQHLDVKPENLFLVAGHLKLGDFGLARQADGESVDSRANALTPWYAAPELYEGRVAETSDQFSLAAVFMEMLTGEKPLQGNEARQVVYQVLTRGPDVSGAADYDQPILQRAMERDPEKRFGSCLEFVDALIRATQSSLGSGVTPDLDQGDSSIFSGDSIFSVPTSIPTVALESSASASFIQRAKAAGSGSADTMAAPSSANLPNIHPVPGHNHSLAAIHNNIGTLLLNGGYMKDALGSFEKALEAGEKLAAEEADSSEHRRELVAVHRNIAMVNGRLGKAHRALKSYQKATAVALALHEEFPERPEIAEELAETYARIGQLYRHMGEYRDAEESYVRACQIHEQLVNDYPTAIDFLDGLAEGRTELASIQQAAGNLEQALGTLRLARDLREQASLEHPHVKDYVKGLAAADHRIGVLLQRMGRYSEALTYYQKSVDIRRRMMESQPDSPEYARDLAASQNNIGVVLQRSGKLDEALQHYEEARNVREKLLWEYPDNAEYAKDLAAAHNNIGGLHQRAGRMDLSLQACRKALEIREALAREHQKSSECQRDLAAAQNNMGVLSLSAGNHADALRSFEMARAIRQKLVDKHPRVSDFSFDLAVVMGNIGGVHQAEGHLEEALAAYQQARVIQSKLAEQHPQRPRYRSVLSATLHHIGSLHAMSKDSQKARDAFEEALALRDALYQSNPEVVTSARDLAATCLGLANLERDSDRVEAALKHSEKALQIREKVAKSSSTEHLRDLAATYNNVGLLQRKIGKLGDALASYGKARDIQYDLVRKSPQFATLRHDLGGTLYNRGSVLFDMGREAEALGAFLQAVDQHAFIVEQQPENTRYRRQLLDDYRRAAEIQLRQSHAIDAAESALKRRSHCLNDPRELFRVAQDLAHCVDLLSGKMESSNVSLDVVKRYTDAAVSVVKQAVAAGFSDFDAVRNDEHLGKLTTAHPGLAELTA